jgi:pimeloyl-ACP methyl ester carboxylesterase
MTCLRLDDGRALAWYEFGDPAGIPCLYLPGTPTSGLIGEVYSDVAAASGVRLIALDKPGYGRSDYAPGRRLLDIAGDVQRLAAQTGLDSLLVVGESGGAPHALALAAALPWMVAAVTVVAGIGPVTERDVAAMPRSTRLLMRLARRSQFAVRMTFAPTRLALLGGRAFDRVQQLAAEAPPADARVFHDHPELAELSSRAAAEALRAGSRGVAQELALFSRPWGFGPASVTAPVDVWHGAQDRNVPVAVARQLAAELPHAQLRIIKDAGHSVGLVVAERMFTTMQARLAERRPSRAAHPPVG